MASLRLGHVRAEPLPRLFLLILVKFRLFLLINVIKF